MSAEELERLILGRADMNRSVAGGAFTTRRVTEFATYAVTGDRAGDVVIHDGPRADAMGDLTVGPSGGGGFLRFVPRTGAVEAGPPLGKWVCRVLRAADDRFGLGFGPMMITYDDP